LACQGSNCTTGRRPAGFVAGSSLESAGLGGYFAEIALLEAASVHAFRFLRDELRHHRAPEALVRAAERARQDEVRHARVTGALARRYGARVRKPKVEKTTLRSLEAMAVENAIEGCVRETYGALLATHQGRAATDPVVRAAYIRIAKDETQHAALAWRVAAWLDSRLDDDARERVLEARRKASRNLATTECTDPEIDLARVAGLPSSQRSRAMIEQMTSSLWS